MRRWPVACAMPCTPMRRAAPSRCLEVSSSPARFVTGPQFDGGRMPMLVQGGDATRRATRQVPDICRPVASGRCEAVSPPGRDGREGVLCGHFEARRRVDGFARRLPRSRPRCCRGVRRPPRAGQYRSGRRRSNAAPSGSFRRPRRPAGRARTAGAADLVPGLPVRDAGIACGRHQGGPQRTRICGGGRPPGRGVETRPDVCGRRRRQAERLSCI